MSTLLDSNGLVGQHSHLLSSPADSKLDTAATVLRMLYIKDLRKLQTQIDEMIVQIQVSQNS